MGTSSSGANFVIVPASSPTTYYAEGFIGSIGSLTFSYTGSIVNWSVPSNVTSITITAAGASGGYNGNTGGRGAIMTGPLLFLPGRFYHCLQVSVQVQLHYFREAVEGLCRLRIMLFISNSIDCRGRWGWWIFFGHRD